MGKDVARVSFYPVGVTIEPCGPDQNYLLGLRGLLTIECFLWTFLSTFVPTSVVDSANNDGPRYEVVLRQTLSVLFWNKSLIYSSLVLLSARSICIPFLQNPSSAALASSVFRRSIRLWFPIAVALAIVKILSSMIGTAHIAHFISKTGNTSIAKPYSLPTALSYFNGVFNLFWTTSGFEKQAGNTAFPSQTMWVVALLYSQSYTVFMTMVIVPYTRAAWRVKAYLCFIFTAWWVQSWAWYSITGLLLADIVMNMGYQDKARQEIKIGKTSKRCPVWIPCGIFVTAGLVWHYFRTDWRPDYQNDGYKAGTGTGLYYSGGIDARANSTEPQPRTDNYLLLAGFFFLLEEYARLQRLFKNFFFVYFGRRSLSESSLPRSLNAVSRGGSIHQSPSLLTVNLGKAFSSCRTSSYTRSVSRYICGLLRKTVCQQQSQVQSASSFVQQPPC